MAVIPFALSFISVVLFVYLLVVGQALLIPLVIAIFIWYLINAIGDVYKRFVPPRFNIVAMTAAVLTFFIVIWIPVEMINGTVPQVIKAAPIYQKNLQSLISNALSYFDIEHAVIVEHIRSHLNFGEIASSLANALTSLAGNTAMVLMYVIFLLAEQATFSQKISLMFKDKKKEQKIRKILDRIYESVRKYLWIKTLMSALTGIASFIIMKLVGIDFAAFWATLIFFLNYIPNIGSIIGTVFPAVLALVQFDTLYPFIVVTGGITAIQILVGNLLEPEVMGRSLNLSPVVIILSLVLWGTLWGVPGMFLCVPLMVMVMITLAEFEKTKPIAILLSQDGRV